MSVRPPLSVYSVPLLLAGLTWMLLDVVPRRGFAAGDVMDPTLINFRQTFVGRCDYHQHFLYPHWYQTPKDCSDLWRKFYWSFAPKGSCDFDVHSYDEFIQASRDNSSTDNNVMYWSGKVTPLVYEFTAETRRYFTIRDYLPGFILKDLMWCGKEIRDEGPGMGIESCRRRRSCGNNTLDARDSFWNGLSADFARSVRGEVRVMLNGSSGEAYRGNRSTFGAYELANLEASRNPVLHVYLVHDIVPRPDTTRETCENGTLVELKKDVEEKGMTFRCTDDPKEVLHLQCVDHSSNALCQFGVSGANRHQQQQQQQLSLCVAALALSLFVPATGVWCPPVC